MSGAKIIASVLNSSRHVGSIPVTIWQLIWSDGGTSFEVCRDDTGEDLTMDGCFDSPPSDDQIRTLLKCPHDGIHIDGRNQFHCNTCGEWLGR